MAQKKKQQVKTECTAVVPYEHELCDDEPNAKTVKELVVEYTQSGFSPEYIARKLDMDIDEFLKEYKTVIDDAIEEMGADFVAVLKAKAFNKDAPVDPQAAKFLLDRFVPSPKELKIIGAKNSARPLVQTPGEDAGLKQPCMSDEILKAMKDDD